MSHDAAPSQIQKMLAVPGVYMISPQDRSGYSLVLVKQDGICHQLKPLGQKDGRAIFRSDGILSDDGWHPEVQVQGPLESAMQIPPPKEI